MNKRNAIVITGPVGSGKTTVMASLTEILEEQNVSCAGIDMDHLRWFFPKLPGHPYGGQVGRKNLAFLAANYRSVGVEVLCIADLIPGKEDRQKLVDTLPDFTVHVIRLSVPMELVEKRLRERETLERLPWYLDRAPKMERMMDARNVGDIVIDVGERDARDVATEIAERLDLLS